MPRPMTISNQSIRPFLDVKARDGLRDRYTRTVRKIRLCDEHGRHVGSDYASWGHRYGCVRINGRDYPVVQRRGRDYWNILAGRCS